MRKNKVNPILVLAAAAFLILSCQGSTDARITGLVKTKLAADSQVNASEINVETTNGVVTLTGNIDSQEAKARALKLAGETSGVHEVVDMISVKVASASGDAPEPDRTVGEHIDDAAITMRVKARLLEDPLVKGLRIDVDTREGVVFLTGTVPNETERKQAVEVAKTTEGVKYVEANFL